MTRIERLSLIGARIETGVVAASMCFGIVVFPYANVALEGWSWIGAAILLFVGVVFAIVLLYLSRRMSLRWLAVLHPMSIVAAGVVLRTVIALLTAPQPVSDGKEYLMLAQRLASGQSYVDSLGNLAFWPPGYPFVLAPFAYVLNGGFSVVLAANLCLYVVSGAAIYALASTTFGRRIAVAALFLLTIWPSYVLMVAVPAKENLTIAAVLSALACFTFALSESANQRGRWIASCIGGATLALGSLAQPGLMLLALLLPFAYREPLRRTGWKGLWLAVAAAAVFGSIMGLWAARNYLVFDRQYLGIATNGGSVLYRANNEIATGLWIEEGKKSLRGYSELEADRIGKVWALDWMRTHPMDMLKLSAKKIFLFLEDDDHGAYWAILRSRDGDEKSAKAALDKNTGRRWSLWISYALSNAFWLLLLASTAWGVYRVMMSQKGTWDKAIPLCYPFLYLLVVHSVFESGSRHHMAPIAVLLIIAAFHMMQSKGASTRTI